MSCAVVTLAMASRISFRHAHLRTAKLVLHELLAEIGGKSCVSIGHLVCDNGLTGFNDMEGATNNCICAGGLFGLNSLHVHSTATCTHTHVHAYLLPPSLDSPGRPHAPPHFGCRHLQRLPLLSHARQYSLLVKE